MINALAERCREGRLWTFVHAKLPKGNGGLHEVRQIIYAALNGREGWSAVFEASREMVFLVQDPALNARQCIDEVVHGRIPGASLRLITTSLVGSGIEQAQGILHPLLPSDDYAARIGLVRFARRSNMFLVLDDDPSVLRSVDHMLKSLGHVETCSIAADFMVAYLNYAPNAVLMDVHLRGENGVRVAADLIKTYDPHAHVIMMSSDAVRESILGSKEAGAKGFIGKPIKHEQLFRHLISSPTFVARHN